MLKQYLLQLCTELCTEAESFQLHLMVDPLETFLITLYNRITNLSFQKRTFQVSIAFVDVQP